MSIDMTAIIVAVIGSGIINTILTHFINLREKKVSNQDEYGKALRLLMKDRLRFLCRKYIEQGWIYEDELEDLIAMHHCYHNGLKGNGFLDKQMEKVNSLEVRGIGVK